MSEIRVPKRSTNINKGTGDVRKVRQKDGIITVCANKSGEQPNSLPRCHAVENDDHSASETRQATGLHKMVDFKLLSLKKVKR